MKLLKKYMSVLLVALTMLCICSFGSYAADDEILHISDFNSLMFRRTTNSDGNYDTIYSFTDGIEKIRGMDMHFWHANDPYYYSAGGQRLLQTFDNLNVLPNHNYDLSFYACLSYNSTIECTIEINGNVVFTKQFTAYYQPYLISANFTMPSYVDGSTQVSIYLNVINPNADFGSAGQNAKFFLSEDVTFVDRTDNPGWLGKVINAIKNIPQSIGNFFSSLSENMKNWFAEQNQKIQDFNDSVGQMFTDLGKDIKQKFVDLGDNIKSFFTTLKNYLLYFQDPVTLNSNGVLVDKYGNPVYTNPFDGPIEKIQNTCDEWILNINDFLNDIDASRIQVKGYLDNGSSLVNGVLSAVPILNICLIFAAGFFVIRKVVGR